MKPIMVNQKEMARWLSLSDRRIRDLTAMKVLHQTTKGYDLHAAVTAYITFLRTTVSTVSDERARLLKSQADMADLKVRERTGELVQRDAFEQAVFVIVRQSREALQNLPSRLSGILAAESDQARIFALLTKEIHQALEELAHDDDKPQ